MAQLGNSTKKLLLNGSKGQEYQPHFIDDANPELYSSKEVYFRWLSRLVFLCALVSLAFFLCSTLVIFRLAPQIAVEPMMLISTPKDSASMVRYEPISNKMQSLKQMTEMFVKQYVIMRNTVINDEQEMTTRWGPGGIVHFLSSNEVYMEFVGSNINRIDRMFDKDYSSEVHIDKIGRESENSPAWSVEFTVFNLSKGRNSSGALTLKTMRYKASVTPRFYPGRVMYRNRLINPLGFTVVKYNQSEFRE